MRRVNRMRAAGVVVVTALAGVAAAGAATPIPGSIAGPVTAVKGKTFTVKTTLSPTGKSKVTVNAKTTITEEAVAKRSELKKGACVMATGTKKGSTVTVSRIALRPKVGGKCVSGFRRQPGTGSGTRPQNGSRPPRNGNGNGFKPPANFGFAAGTVTAVKGATLTVKGQNGSTKVVVSKKAQVTTTITVKPSAIKVKLCAFVRGTSADKGVTVTAENIALSQPVGGSCTGRRRGP